jgi:hypothetical protein
MSDGKLTPRRARDPENQTNGKWCCADATPEYPGGTCGNYPVKGGTVCFQSHGGAASQVRRKGQERLKEQEASKALEKHKSTLGGSRLGISNIDAMLWMLEEAAQNVLFYQDQVRLLKQGKGGKNAEGEFEDGLYSFIPMVGDVEHVMVKKYDQERDRLFKIAADCSKIGIEARRVEIVQEQAEILIKAQIAGWDAVGLDAAQRDVANKAVVGALRDFKVIEGGA